MDVLSPACPPLRQQLLLADPVKEFESLQILASRMKTHRLGQTTSLMVTVYQHWSYMSSYNYEKPCNIPPYLDFQEPYPPNPTHHSSERSGA